MEKLTAAGAIRKLAQQYEAMIEAAEALERLGSLEQAESETAKRVESLHEQERTLRAALVDVTAQADEVKAAAATILLNANVRADEIRSEAEATAKVTMEDAEKRAAVILEGAAQSVSRMKESSQVMLDELARKRDEAGEVLANVLEKLGVKTAELAETEAKIASHREAMREFVGP